MAINAAHVYHSAGRGIAHSYSTYKTKIIIALLAICVIVAGLMADEERVTASFRSHQAEFIILRLTVLIFLFMAIFYETVIPALLNQVQQIIAIVKVNYIVIFLLVLALVYNSRRLAREDLKNNNYLSERKMIDDVARNNNNATIVCENCVHNNHGIYYDFDPAMEGRLDFINWNKISMTEIEELARHQPVYMLCSKDRIRWYLRLTPAESRHYNPLDSVPRFVLNPGPGWEVVMQNSRTALYRYKGDQRK